jgi:hypothetical protein
MAPEALHRRQRTDAQIELQQSSLQMLYWTIQLDGTITIDRIPWYLNFGFGYLGMLMCFVGVILFITGCHAVVQAPKCRRSSRRALEIHCCALVAAIGIAFLLHNLVVLNVFRMIQDYPPESPGLLIRLEEIPRHDCLFCTVILVGMVLGAAAVIRSGRMRGP